MVSLKRAVSPLHLWLMWPMSSVSGIGTGFVLSCLCVVRCDAGVCAVFAFLPVPVSFGQRQLVNCLLSFHWCE